MRIIVSGYRRSGTSAMMKALVTGLTIPGITLAYDPFSMDGDHGNMECDGYKPNPSPLYETRGAWRTPAFLRNLPDNVLIKIFFDGLTILPSGDYAVIFMQRDPAEIALSLEMVDKHFKRVGFTERQPPSEKLPFDCYRPYKQADIDHVLGIVEQRRDINLIRVNHKDLIERPIEVFQAIRGSGIDLDVDKCASVIDAKHYRARKHESVSRCQNLPPDSESPARKSA